MKRFMSVAIISLFLSLSLSAFAEVQTFIKEYSYQASEADSKLSCRVIALEQVKRLLLEELGTYLKSHTEVRNFQLTKDQITVLTAGIVKAEVMNEKWDGKTYILQAKIAADPDNVAKDIHILRGDVQKTKELEETRKKAEEALKEIERLKKEIALGKADRAQSMKSYKAAVTKLNTTNWEQKGFELFAAKKTDEAIEAFKNAIELYPDNTNAYISLGNIYGMLGRNRDVIELLSKAIELNPDDVYRHYKFRGIAYTNVGKQKQAIQDFDKAIELNPDDFQLYNNRAWAYTNLGNLKRAIQDFDKAIEMNPEDAGLYYSRGLARTNLGNNKRGLEDITIAAKMGDKGAQKYLQDQGYKW
ncbi:MAG: tetratricopeptide repeat protein [Deltaproteobacteria bacterium]|nr:tetratricopeptide repeat protein [Deltaproteobacteria bacterium]